MSTNNPILDRTCEAFGKDLVEKIEKTKFTILGCGAVGSLFAEMLVRSGATKLSLVDGDCIDPSNLNRTTAFLKEDIDKPKVTVLKKRLEAINSDICVESLHYHFRKQMNLEDSDDKLQQANNMIESSGIVVIAMDDRVPRNECETMCWQREIVQLSIGIETKQFGEAWFECAWNQGTPEPSGAEVQGYGHGSYASIVMEATAAGFGMLLHHIVCPQSNRKYLKREFKDYLPVQKPSAKAKKTS